MQLSRRRLLGLVLALLLPVLGAALPARVHAHGDGLHSAQAIDGPSAPPEGDVGSEPAELTTIVPAPTAAPRGGAFALLALSIGLAIALRLRVSPLRVRLLRRRAAGGLTWAVVGALALYLVSIPPHLVHHIGGPEAEAVRCALFVLGGAADQGTVESVFLVAGPAFAAELSSPSSPALVPHTPPPACGRSPPDLSA